MNRRLAIALLLLLATPLVAQKKQLTLDAVYHPTARVAFNGVAQTGFHWIDDNSFYWPRKDAKGRLVEYTVFDVTTGKQRSLVDRSKLRKALESAGLPADVAADAANSSGLEFDGKQSSILLSLADDLYLYSPKGTVTRLTSAPGEEEQATFSPDGQRVAFVRANDLYVVDLTGRERRLTTDGSKTILNGKLDWLYQEEIYGRGTWKSYWWSADSARIAFLQLDESQVPEYTVVDDIAYRPDLNVYPYPKAGDPNPRVALKIVPATGGEVVTVDNSRYGDGDEFLIVNVDWDENALTYQVQNREQSWLDLVTADVDGESRTLIRDTTKAWVDPIANPHWLDDGTFLWQSERNGWRHVYHYKPDGTLIRQVTNGEWEVRDLHGTDGTFVYITATERSHVAQDTYKIRLDGNGMKRLTNEPGVHSTLLSPGMKHFIDNWSNVTTPAQARLYTNEGKLLHVIEENRVAVLAEYDLPTPEFMQVKTRDGFVMEAMMIKPTNFDPAKKYPVFQFLYAAPHAQSVRNNWGSTSRLFYQLIAQQGVIVWLCDNRTASGKGAVSSWPAYKNPGPSELSDIEDGIAWLKQQPYIDGSRVMLSGWSYGGFVVAYAMTHSKTFSAGIAGAPVTDWRAYDSVYTERLMLLPQNNPEGYRAASPRFAAKDLHGRLLLIHGTTDDNVHLQNTLQFAHELQQLGKPFEMMLYPRTRHTVYDRKTQYHVQGVMLDFIRRELLTK